MVICGALGEDVPDDHEQLAGDGDDGDALGLVATETCERGFPIGVRVDSDPCGFDEDAAEIAASFFGDVALGGGFAAVVDARAQACIADQVFGGGEAGDVPDGGEDGYGTEQSQPWELDEERHGVIPGGLVAEVCEFAIEVGELLFDVLEGVEVLAQTQPFGRGEVKGKPPGAVVGGERIAAWQFDLLAMENAVEAVLDGGALFDESAPMSQQGAEFADVAGRDPHFRNKISGEEFGEADGIVFVGFDSGVCDPFDLKGVSDDDALDEGREEVVEPPGVAGGFEDDDIGGVEMGGCPGGEVVEVNGAGGW